MKKQGLWAHMVVVCLFGTLGLRAQKTTSFASSGQDGAAASTSSPSAQDSVVPRLIQFSGVVKESTGKLVTGSTTLTFSLYQFPEGGTPLWSETQKVTLDNQGHYAVLLGAESPTGLPLDLFTSGQARWLGIQAQLPGEGEQPRVLLVGVPYALKAADAETLGGKPPSAFVTTESQAAPQSETGAMNAGGSASGTTSGKAATKAAAAQATATTTTGSGTTNYVPLWTSSTSLGNSVLFQSGGNVGVATTTPTNTFTVNKGATAGFGIDVSGTNDTRVRIGRGQPTAWSWSDGWLRPGDFSLIEEGKSGNRIYIKPGGNVGLGTSAPSTILEVNKGTTAGGGIIIDGTNDTRLKIGVGQPTVWSWSNGWLTPGDFSLLQEGVSGNRIYVKPTGNVGIGTTTPAATLEVNGTGKFDGLVTFAGGQLFPGAASLGSNTFVGNQTVTGNLSLTGSINSALTLQNPPPDSNGNTGANVIGGTGNSVSAGVIGATIAGGGGVLSGPIPAPNAVLASFGTIGGGFNNKTAGQAAAIAGGEYNAAFAPNAAVGGGNGNTASGNGAAVPGGIYNTASGDTSFVAGGNGNTASGTSSFAAGTSATATNDGSFVWGDDSTTSAVTDGTKSNAFVARAVGGFAFYTSSDLSTGATLPSGSGSWSSLSDRNVKANLAAVDGQTLLTKLAELPILTWNYKAQSPFIRHLGPMAQDFRAAFNLGEDDKHISTVDEGGVALASIQALYSLSREKDLKIEELTREVQNLESRLSQMEQVLLEK